MSPVIDIRDVSRVHGNGIAAVQALRGVSLQINAGELVAIMGPSGSGKSTLLTIAGGLDQPTAGEVHVEGAPLHKMSLASLAKLRRRRIGYVFQELNLIPSLTAAENVALPLELDGMNVKKARELATESLTATAVPEKAFDRYPEDMSGGQQQRVAIARALVGDRRVLLADEPTGALDTNTGESVMRLLRKRCDEGAAGLLVTHDQRNAGWADRIVYLRDGLIVDNMTTSVYGGI